MKKAIDYTKFKVGKKVWSPFLGWGEITEILDDDFPVTAAFKNNDRVVLTAGGFLNLYDEIPFIYLNEFSIPDSAYESPVELNPDMSGVAVDTPIWVREFDRGGWNARHFAKYDKERCYAFDCGQTSHTTKKVTDWNYWTLEKPQ